MSSYSYAWRRRRLEDLAAASYECTRCAAPDRPMGLHSNLERAHLDGDAGNDAPENVCVLCRTCHRAHDYEPWIAVYRAWRAEERERRLDRLDAARPILNYTRWQEFLDTYGLEEAS